MLKWSLDGRGQWPYTLGINQGTTQMLFFTIHSETGQRIGDDSEYPFGAADLDALLASLNAERVALADGQPAWEVDGGEGRIFVRTVGVEG